MITKEEFEYRLENGMDTTVKWIENNRIYKGYILQYDTVRGGKANEILFEQVSVEPQDIPLHRIFSPSALYFVINIINHKANDLYKIWEGGL